jgi:hypothetical protein
VAASKKGRKIGPKKKVLRGTTKKTPPKRKVKKIHKRPTVRKGEEPVWVGRFLKALSEMPVVHRALRMANIGKTEVYRRRKKYPEFAKRWDDAIETGIAVYEERAFERTAVSDTMNIFMLKCWKPDRYRETVHHGFDNEMEITIKHTVSNGAKHRDK